MIRARPTSVAPQNFLLGTKGIGIVNASLDMKRKIAVSLTAAAGLSLPIISTALASAQETQAPEPQVETIVPVEVGDMPTASTLQAYAAYWDSGYNYGQLLELAESWNVGEFEAKARAGELILEGRAAEFEPLVEGVADIEFDDVGGSAAYPDGSFWDAGYSYQDAQALAEEWQIDTYDAKARAADLITGGQQTEIDQILANR